MGSPTAEPWVVPFLPPRQCCSINCQRAADCLLFLWGCWCKVPTARQTQLPSLLIADPLWEGPRPLPGSDAARHGLCTGGGASPGAAAPGSKSHGGSGGHLPRAAGEALVQVHAYYVSIACPPALEGVLSFSLALASTLLPPSRCFLKRSQRAELPMRAVCQGLLRNG